MAEKQTAGRTLLGDLAPTFADGLSCGEGVVGENVVVGEAVAVGGDEPRDNEQHTNAPPSAGEAIRLSCRQTSGIKGELFILDLSFIGWEIVASLTFGLLNIWLIPYYHTACSGLHVKWFLRQTGGER